MIGANTCKQCFDPVHVSHGFQSELCLKHLINHINKLEEEYQILRPRFDEVATELCKLSVFSLREEKENG